jgi:type IV pilus assembly protein PilW
VRIGLIDEVLPLCADLAAGGTDDEVRIATSGGGGPAGCDPVPDDDGDGWPDNVQAWRVFRDAQGGAVAAYVYDPVDDVGEFFTYDADGSDEDWLHRASSEPWSNEYLAAEQCRVYLLEQRTYELGPETLRFEINGESAEAINVAAQIVDFQLRAVMSDGSIQLAFGAADDRRDLEAVEVSLDGELTQDGETARGEISARFFPRNILSL